MNNAFLELLDGSSLYSDRTTRDGTFSGKREYPTNFNKIISPGKKAIAILQQDGNFKILLGNFNAAGEPKRPDGSFETDPMLAGNYSREVWSTFALTAFNIPNIGIAKSPFELVFNSLEGFYIRSLPAGMVYKFDVGGFKYEPYSVGYRLYLTDDGDLRIDKGTSNIWSTKFAATQVYETKKEDKGVGVQTESTQQQQSQQAQQAQQAAAAAQAAAMQPSLMSSPIILIAAAAAAFFFFRK